MTENNALNIYENDRFFDTQNRPKIGAVIEFARLEKIRK